MATADALSPPEPDVFIVPDGFEAIDGRLVEKAMSRESSWTATQIVGRLFVYAQQTGAGEPYGADTAYRCFPGRPRHVRKPDASFLRRERAAAVPRGPGELRIPPDLVVEVTSPNESVAEIGAKVNDFRAVGVPLVWVIDPDNRQATIYTPDTIREVGEDGELPVDDVLPGFRLRLADVLLPPLPPSAE
jgi:Uma2 family endonuclease